MTTNEGQPYLAPFIDRNKIRTIPFLDRPAIALGSQ